jgi:hypothetical protein
MALDAPDQNKMMTAPPAKKGYHFAATADYLAEYIEAATIEEAAVIYHKVKRLIEPAAVAPVEPAPVVPEQPLSTPPESEEDAEGANLDGI